MRERIIAILQKYEEQPFSRPSECADEIIALFKVAEIPTEEEDDEEIVLGEPDKLNFTAMRGWVCPVCGKGNSPYSTQCGCTPPIKVWTGLSTNVD
jgi:hypothetical protein